MLYTVFVQKKVPDAAKILRTGGGKDAVYPFRVSKFMTGGAKHSCDHVQAVQIVLIRKEKK